MSIYYFSSQTYIPKKASPFSPQSYSIPQDSANFLAKIQYAETQENFNSGKRHGFPSVSAQGLQREQPLAPTIRP